MILKDCMICLFINLVGVQSTGVEEAATYAGLVYYEEKRAEDLVTFTAAKKLSALLEVNFNYGIQLLIVFLI